MVTDDKATGCKSEMAALTAHDRVAVISGLFCPGNSL